MNELKKNIAEKQTKAEKKRLEYLQSLKAKSVSSLSNLIETKEDMIPENATKLMQDAAMERRKLQQEEKRKKQNQDLEKRKEMIIKKELEKQQRVADKIAFKQEKLKRIEEFKIIKQAEEEVFV